MTVALKRQLVSFNDNNRALQQLDLSQTCKNVEGALVRANCECQKGGPGLVVTCDWQDQFCDEGNDCACVSTTVMLSLDDDLSTTPVNGEGCFELNEKASSLNLSICSLVEYCDGVPCECEVTLGSEKCADCQICNDGEGVILDCDNIFPSESTGGVCVTLDQDLFALGLTQTTDGLCTSGVTSSTHGVAIAIGLALLTTVL